MKERKHSRTAPGFLAESLGDGKHQRGRFVGGEQEFCFRHFWFEMSIRQPCGNVQYRVG